MPRIYKKSEVYRLFNTSSKTSNEKLQKFICKFCKWKTSKNTSRMISHIGNSCTSCPRSIKEKFSAIQCENAVKTLSEVCEAANGQELEDILNNGLGQPSTLNSEILASSSKSLISKFVGSMSDEENSEIDRLFARIVYSANLAHSVVENEHVKKFFNKIRPDWKMPSRYKLSNNLLEQEYQMIKAIANTKISEAYSLGIMADGWSNVRRESIINIVLTLPEPIFFKSLNSQTNRHTAVYMSTVLSNVIEEVGPDKFIALVTDNAANMKATWRIITEKYPNIVSYGCVAHGLNLLFLDVSKLPVCKDVTSKTQEIIKEIRNSHIMLATFKEKQVQANISNKSLKLSVPTRWGSNLHSLRSLYANKCALKFLCITEGCTMSTENKARILSDDFWDQIEKIVEFLGPIADSITFIESDLPRISNVLGIFKKLEDSFLKLFPVFQSDEISENTLMDILKKRKNFCISKIHLAATLLDPKLHGTLNASESVDAMETIYDIASNTPEIDANTVMGELALYNTKEEFFGKEFLWKCSLNIPSITWWKGLCSSQQLSRVAIKILSAPATSAAVERSFSKQILVQSKLKNRLTNERTEKLVYVSSNLKLISEKKAEPQKKPSDEQSASSSANSNEPESNIEIASEELDELEIVYESSESDEEESDLVQNYSSKYFLDSDQEESDLDLNYYSATYGLDFNEPE